MMKDLLRIAKKSAKRIYQGLKKKGPFYSEVLEKKIFVTKLFLNHITNISKKNRTYKEIIERILIIPFFYEILNEGVLKEVRNYEYGKTFLITFENGSDVFCVLILEGKNSCSILSCFREYTEKRGLS